jgi:hypothetical protein
MLLGRAPPRNMPDCKARDAKAQHRKRCRDHHPSPFAVVHAHSTCLKQSGLKSHVAALL